jgi:hypothetical protein
MITLFKKQETKYTPEVWCIFDVQMWALPVLITYDNGGENGGSKFFALHILCITFNFYWGACHVEEK